jgi:O-methyltransferase
MIAPSTVVAGFHYDKVTPQAAYAPWLGDSEFQDIYRKIKADTLVDEYRCFELWQLVSYAGRIAGDILEIGVWRGGTGAVIATKASQCSPQKTVWLCDTFAGVVKASEADPTYRGGEHADTSEARVRGLMARLKLDNVSVVKGIFPDESVREVTSTRFSFVHIDVDVYASGRDVMEHVWPMLQVGGLVVFDDFGFRACGGITKLVEGYRTDHDKLVVHNLNGHGIVVKMLA